MENCLGQTHSGRDEKSITGAMPEACSYKITPLFSLNALPVRVGFVQPIDCSVLLGVPRYASSPLVEAMEIYEVRYR